MVLRLALVKIISYACPCEQGQDADLCVPYAKEHSQAQLAKCYPCGRAGGQIIDMRSCLQPCLDVPSGFL